jgi:cytochrome c
MLRQYLALAVGTIAAAGLPAAARAGDAAAGQRDFNRCIACHAAQPGKNGIGPSLAGVVGRTSGSLPAYSYSPAMKNAHVTWDEATLDKFLANPQGVVHGTKMFVNIPDATARSNVIAYLATLK